VGDDFDSVNNGTGGTSLGNQTDPFFLLGFGTMVEPRDPYPGGLVPGTTYYWRIDEVEADGTTVHKGDIWSFTVPPRTAINPNPADGAEFVDLNVELSWSEGLGAIFHTVYFGDDFDTVSAAAGGAQQAATTHTPGPLDGEKVYYWRVDETDTAGATHKGDVWAFSTPGAVGNPSPANGATGVQMNATLGWTPADSATSSDVYLGTDKDAVRSATTASPEYLGNKPLGSESHDPGKLAWKSTYYWRVDGISAAGLVKGIVWSFETADFITVDDFESYNEIWPEQDEESSNLVFMTWADGYNVPENGSAIGALEAFEPTMETSIVHEGSQSAPLYYDNTDVAYSEVTAYVANQQPAWPPNTLAIGPDWTEEGVGVLSLWFRGDASNAPEPMYVILNGSATVYNGDPAAAQTGEWTEWTIDLQEFASQGVDLTNVNSISIGLGDKNNAQAGGSGKIFLDHVALYRPAAAPAPVLTVSPLSSLEAETDPANPTTLTSVLSINGTSASSLIVGTTTTDFEKHAGREAVHADNMDLTTYASLDDSTWIQTMFDQPVTTIFMMERGANDSGFFQALDADGNPTGEMVAFTAADFQLPDAGLKIVNQNAGGVAIESTAPISGLRILPPEGKLHSIDPASISAIAAP
jgi:hypothetical protein